MKPVLHYKVPKKGRLVRIKADKKRKVWLVEETMKVIHGRDNEHEPLKFWPLTPSRVETAAKNGDPIIRIARLGKASDLHEDGATRARSMDISWVPFDDLEPVQYLEAGWKTNVFPH